MRIGRPARSLHSSRRAAAAAAEPRVGRKGASTLCAGDHGRSRRRRPAAVGAEVRSPHEGCTARAARRRSGPAQRDRGRKERLELLQPLVECGQLLAALDQEILAELIPAKHLQHEPAEIAQPLFAQLQEDPTLPAKLPGMGEWAARRCRRRNTGQVPLAVTAEA